MFKIVAFDMDGTIADTIPMCIQAFQNSISPYVDHELGEKEIMKTFGLNEIGMVKSVVTQDWESAIKDFYDQYEQLHDKVTEMFPDMLRLLMFLKKQKIVVALITGKGEKCCAITLKSTHNRRERPVYGHRGGSRGRFYYRITTFEGRPWDARDPHKTTFMALSHAIRLSI